MKRRSHAIKTTTSARTRLFQALAVIAVVGLLGGLYVVRGGTSSDGTAPSPVAKAQALTPESGVAGYEGSTRAVTVYIDGWTMATLGTTSLRANVGGLSASLNFSPVDKSAIEDLVKTEPQIVTSALARLVSGDRRLVCIESGCSIGGDRVDPTVLADAATIETFGASYAAWGIESGLYSAAIAIPETADVVNFSAPGYDDMSATFGILADEVGGKDSPMNGKQVTTTYLGAAYGQIFPVLPMWSDAIAGGDAVRMERRDISGTSGGNYKSAAGSLSSGPGATDARELSAGLNPSQLTYLSSPTTGCGPVPVCTPAPLSITRKATTKEFAICSADGAHGSILVTTTESNVPFNKAAHTAGAWSKTAVENFPGAARGSSVLGYTGTPPLSDRPTTLYSVEVLLVDVHGIVAVAGTRDSVPLQLELKPSDLFDGQFKSC